MVTRTLQACVVLVAVVDTASAQWRAYSIQRTGLFGHEHTGANEVHRSTVFSRSTPTNVSGVSARYVIVNGVTSGRGQDAWAYNALTNTTVRTGLSGPDYSNGDGFHFSEIDGVVQANNYVVGISRRIVDVSQGNNGHTWLFDRTNNSNLRTGLTGPEHTGSAGAHTSRNRIVNADGQVVGDSVRYTGVDTPNGLNAWAYDPATNTTRKIGLVGPAYTGSEGYEESFAFRQTTAGHIVGQSTRISGMNTPNGSNPWVWSPASHSTLQLGLTGPAHTGSAGYQNSQILTQNTHGVVGYSVRIADVNTNNGQDAWVWNPNNGIVTQIGLTGPAHTGSGGYQKSQAQMQNSVGVVVGWSDLIAGMNTSNGQSAWVYIPATNTTEQIGLTGPEYTGSNGRQTSQVDFLNNEGQIAGWSARLSGVNLLSGVHTWAYDAASHSITRTGLTEAVHTTIIGGQHSNNVFQNEGGQIAGQSGRFSPVEPYEIGRNAWAFDPLRGTVVQVGLTTTEHTGTSGIQYSNFSFQSPQGHLAGYSTRYTDVNEQNGSNTWAYDPIRNETVQTGLTGTPYTGSGGYQFSRNTFQNAAGQIAGDSQRIAGINNSNGLGAWYYDPITNVTSEIVGSVRASDQYANCTPSILTEDGSLLGTYMYFEGGDDTGEQRAFIFRPDLGFADLGSLVAGGLGASGWTVLSQPLLYDASTGTIVGYGKVNGQSGGQSVFVMMVGTPTCIADVDDGSGTGMRDDAVDINDLLRFLVSFESLNDAADLDDGTSTGTPDGSVTIDDLLFFLVHFEAGC